MIIDDDRKWFQFQRERLEDARRGEDPRRYHRIYHDMLTTAQRLVADQRWWEFWSKDEAFAILRGVLAIPPYLGDPADVGAQRAKEDLDVHRRIRTTLRDQIESLETTELAVQIVDYAATAAGMAIGAGSAAIAIRELVKRVGVRKAGEFLAMQFLKSRIQEEVQDRAIDGLARALGADPATAHMALGLVAALKDARRGGLGPARPQIAGPPAPPSLPRPRMEPRVSPETLQRLKLISVRVQTAPPVSMPPWHLRDSRRKQWEIEGAVHELRAAMLEEFGWFKTEVKWTGAVGRRVDDGKLIFASSGRRDDPKVVAVMRRVAERFGGEVIHDPGARRLPGPKGSWQRRIYDAEAKILWSFDVDEIGATHAICHDCQSVLARSPGVTPVTPLRSK